MSDGSKFYPAKCLVNSNKKITIFWDHWNSLFQNLVDCAIGFRARVDPPFLVFFSRLHVMILRVNSGHEPATLSCRPGKSVANWVFVKAVAHFNVNKYLK